jgi:hypothetical protein
MTVRMRLVRCSLLQIGLILLSFQSVAIPALAKLQAAVILPHGDFAVDPSLVPANTKEREAADAVAKAAAEVGHWLSRHVDPDLIFLSTPHGIALSTDFGIYLGSTASGSADIGKDLHNASHASYRVHLPTIALDPRLSQQLVEELIALQQNISAIQVYADDSFDIPLQWAEVIPLMLIPPRQKQSQLQSSPLRQRRLDDAVSTASTQLRRHLILSQPLRRYTHAPDMVAELVALGRMLRIHIDPMDLTVTRKCRRRSMRLWDDGPPIPVAKHILCWKRLEASSPRPCLVGSRAWCSCTACSAVAMAMTMTS